MRVAQINSNCQDGSTGKISVAISEMLNNKGIENVIYYSGYNKSNYKQAVAVNNPLGIRVHQILSALFGNQGFHSAFSTLRLIRKLKKFSPSVIHLHNIHGYYLNYSILFKYLSKFDGLVVWTLHDCHSFTGHCPYFTKANCEKWKTGCYNCPLIKEYPYSWFFDRSEKLYKKKKDLFCRVPDMVITTVSKWLCSVTKMSFLNKYPILPIPNGINTELFKPYDYSDIKKLHNCEDKKVILGVANNWSERKGLSHFLTLSKMLSDDYRIILIGLKPEQIRQLPQNIIGLSRTDSAEELAKYYSAADVFFNASLEETFGLTTVEALSCGTPVIVYNSTACSEVVIPDVGIVVEPGKIEDVYNAVDLICNRDKKIYTQKCRDYAVNKYDNNLIYQKYYQVYEEHSLRSEIFDDK